MPRPVRELWNGLGARPGDDDDLLVVGADALALESVFGGEVGGDVVVRLFSDEAFGFSAPDELAALGVFWAPHLENGKQLRAAITDAQDRLKRRIEEESEQLARLGLRARLEPPLPVSRGSADIGGHALEVALGQNGELLLERVNGGEVPEAQREVLRDLSDATAEAVQDELAARAHRLVDEGVVQAVAPEGVIDDDIDFDEGGRTAQLPAVKLQADPGTELVPPPSDDDEAAIDDEPGGGAMDLAAALDDDDLLDSQEGAPVAESDAEEEPAVAAALGEGDAEDAAADGLDEDEEERTLGAEDLPDVTAQVGPPEHDDVEAPGEPASDDSEDFVRPVTAPALDPRTRPPASFDDDPALPTLQMRRVSAGDFESQEEPGLSDLASGFDEDTGEQAAGAVLSLSGDDGVMPSPAEATQLRPAPTSAELGLDDADADLATPPQGRPPSALPEDDDSEETVARRPLFTGRKGPSLVSSGSAGSSVDEDAPAAPDAHAMDAAAGAANAAEGLLEEDLDTPTALHASPPIVDEDDAGPGAEDDEELHDADARAADADDAAEPEAAEQEAAEREASEESAAPSLEALDGHEAEPTDPRGKAARAAVSVDPEPASSLEVELDVDVDPSDEAAENLEASGFETGEFSKGAREAAVATALASLGDDRAEEQTEAGLTFTGPSRERLDALAAIVGEGMSSGKTGAIVLDADAFAYLREAGGEPASPDEDPDALEREAERLERKARELRAKAELLRERATAPVSRRTLASALEKARAARAEQAAASEPAVSAEQGVSAERVPSDEAEGAFASSPDEGGADLDDGPQEVGDAFADGVALEEVRAMLAAESGGDVYAETQLAEMDLGDLRQPSHSGGVFEGGGQDDDSPPYALDDHTGRGAALRTSMASLPQAASADVQALESQLERSAEPAAAPRKPATRTPSASRKQPVAARALALVVSDPRARERLKKHLEETFPHVVELASPGDAAALSAKDVQAVVIVRPVHDDVTVSGLEALEGSRGRPPVLVLSSDASFDGLPAVDLRLELGRRASEVAKQVLDGLTTLGVRASA